MAKIVFNTADCDAPFSAPHNSLISVDRVETGVVYLKSAGVTMDAHKQNIQALSFDKMKVASAFSKVQYISTAPTAADVTLDLNNYSVFYLAFNGDKTISFDGPDDGSGGSNLYPFIIFLQHDATSDAHTLTWNDNILTSNGDPITLTNTANSVDVLSGFLRREGGFFYIYLNRQKLNMVPVGAGQAAQISSGAAPAPAKRDAAGTFDVNSIEPDMLVTGNADGTLNAISTKIDATTGTITTETVMRNCTIGSRGFIAQTVATSADGPLVIDLALGTCITLNQAHDITNLTFLNYDLVDYTNVVVYRHKDSDAAARSITFDPSFYYFEGTPTLTQTPDALDILTVDIYEGIGILKIHANMLTL